MSGPCSMHENAQACKSADFAKALVSKKRSVFVFVFFLGGGLKLLDEAGIPKNINIDKWYHKYECHTFVC